MRYRRYVYDIRRHALPEAEWDGADKLVAMLLKSVEDDEPIEMTSSQGCHKVPPSVAMFLLDGLVRLCGESEISMVILATEGRLTIPKVHEMTDINERVLHNVFKNRGLKKDCLTSFSKPAWYDQKAVLETLRIPIVNDR